MEASSLEQILRFALIEVSPDSCRRTNCDLRDRENYFTGRLTPDSKYNGERSLPKESALAVAAGN
jgi:hypothetical protein